MYKKLPKSRGKGAHPKGKAETCEAYRGQERCLLKARVGSIVTHRHRVEFSQAFCPSSKLVLN